MLTIILPPNEFSEVITSSRLGCWVENNSKGAFLKFYSSVFSRDFNFFFVHSIKEIREVHINFRLKKYFVNAEEA